MEKNQNPLTAWQVHCALSIVLAMEHSYRIFFEHIWHMPHLTDLDRT